MTDNARLDAIRQRRAAMDGAETDGLELWLYATKNPIFAMRPIGRFTLREGAILSKEEFDFLLSAHDSAQTEIARLTAAIHEANRFNDELLQRLNEVKDNPDTILGYGQAVAENRSLHANIARLAAENAELRQFLSGQGVMR